jgi:hypothetical protein
VQKAAAPSKQETGTYYGKTKMSVTKARVSVLFPMLKVFSMTKRNFSAYQSLIEDTSVRS